MNLASVTNVFRGLQSLRSFDKENFQTEFVAFTSNFSLDKMIYRTLWALFDFKLRHDDDEEMKKTFTSEGRKSHFQSRIREKDEKKVHLSVIGNPIINQSCFSAREMK